MHIASKVRNKRLVLMRKDVSNMQYLLTEKEYNELKRNETILNNVNKYLLENLREEHYTDYAYRNEVKLCSFEGTRTTIDVNPMELLELLGININRNIVVNFTT